MTKIRQAFENGKAFIPFITCGDPDLETTAAAVRAAAENGADLIELGIPFSDPTAEGPVIQGANIRALNGGVNTDKVFGLVRELRKDVKIPLVFMTYANVVFSYGAERFISTCAQTGIDGIILPDIPFEEKDEFLPLCRQYGVDLISFDDFDLNALKQDGALRRGCDLSKVYGDSSYVLATWDQNSPWEVGDIVSVGDETVTIAGVLKYDPFSSNGLTDGKLTLIASNETFVRLTGITDYSLVLIQTAPDVAEDDAAAIRKAAEEYGGRFQDERDQRTSGTYFAFTACCYAFLGIIALVSVLNIVNSIAMSVSARIRQYGAMRAVGMDGRQITKMILAEAITYAFWGCVTGCVIGLLFSRSLYGFLITSHFPYAVWSPPVGSLTLMILFVLGAAFIAAAAPAKRIRNLSITETISEL